MAFMCCWCIPLKGIVTVKSLFVCSTLNKAHLIVIYRHILLGANFLWKYKQFTEQGMSND